jgi:predicted ABC-type ATPase
VAEKPTIYLFGGGNGSGKTSFARAFLPNEIGSEIRFLNADEIARGLSPFSPESVAFKAGRLLLTEIESCLGATVSFGLESTLSGKTYVGMLARAKSAGYEIELHYLWLGSADMAVRRVRRRVRMGGHSVPERDIRRRYSRSLTHFGGPLVHLAKSGE